MSLNREWMYRRYENGNLTTEFLDGVESFIKFACSQPTRMNGEKIKCPCKKCKNRPYMEPFTVRLHVAKNGFTPNYHTWKIHGEPSVRKIDDTNLDRGHETTSYHRMVMDARGSRLNISDTEEPPNPEAQKFYDMLKAADKELWPGCKNHSQLSLVARLMSLKSEHSFSEKCFDQILELLKEILPEDNEVIDNFYSAKKLLSGMGLPIQKIDCCPKNCMIFWDVDSELVECKICGSPRFKDSSQEVGKKHKTRVALSKMYYFPLTPRLQRLYASKATSADMRWHASSIEDGVMCHPANSLAWKHFNKTFPEFASETRNVRLGLCTDGFQPFGQSGQQYSSWPIIVTPYNLPPWACMKEHHMFLTILVPGPHNPTQMIDVFLQPLILELKDLWKNGVLTYDVSLKNNFQMRAALMWTINDFPAYSMLSGWSTAGRLACPHCMRDTSAFTLPISGKQSWFDEHRKFLPFKHSFRYNKKAFIKNKVIMAHPPKTKTGAQILGEIEMLGLKKVTEVDADESNIKLSKRLKRSDFGWKKKSIFWDLPYWSSLLIRHNLDVMHIEKNVFDNIFNTVMNVQGKTKDTCKSREELNQLCNRPELKRNEATGQYPKACYMLDKDEKTILCEWVKSLKFPDGYASNLSRCVDMRRLQMFGMKSHDCHVFMQRILPIAFRELLPANVWKPITELCLFFKELTSANIKTSDMCELHDKIPVILCKLERIFPPSFFDSMEHLPVHLADEARIAGPVQYRWMYPFERYLHKLKKNVKNKARVEGSICNSYLVEEASSFCMYYFEDHIRTRHRKEPRNYDGRGDVGKDDHPDNLSIFKHAGRAFGKISKRFLDDKEYDAAHTYVLLNCTEVTKSYVDLFVDQMKVLHPCMSTFDIQNKLDAEFASWFKSYAMDPNNEVFNKFIRDLSRGPLRRVTTCEGYFVNGYNFHTVEYGARRSTMNSGVCIKGSDNGIDVIDYYGRLLEVVVLEYPGLPIKKTTLFKCEWFDPSPLGTSVHPDFKLVSINHTRRYSKYEPFVLANQAIQVYYCSYPSKKRSKKDWWEVVKIKARANIELPVQEYTSVVSPPFQDDGLNIVSSTTTIDDEPTSTHPDGGLVDIEDDDELHEDHEDRIDLSDFEDNNYVVDESYHLI